MQISELTQEFCYHFFKLRFKKKIVKGFHEPTRKWPKN